MNVKLKKDIAGKLAGDIIRADAWTLVPVLPEAKIISVTYKGEKIDAIDFDIEEN